VGERLLKGGEQMKRRKNWVIPNDRGTKSAAKKGEGLFDPMRTPLKTVSQRGGSSFKEWT